MTSDRYPGLPRLAIVLAVLAAVLAGLGLVGRYRAESANRSAGLAMEMRTIEQFALASGKSLDQVLAELQKAGLTGVAMSELRVRDLIDSGSVTLLPPSPLGTEVAVAGDPMALEPIASRLQSAGIPTRTNPSGGLFVQGTVDALLDLPIGLDPVRTGQAREAGLAIIARHGNTPGTTPATLRWTLQRSAQLGATYFLPEGDQVLGSPGLAEQVVAAMRENGLAYCSPEFTTIVGDAKVLGLMKDQAIRLHSIQQLEAVRTTDSAVVERFAKAFRERKMGWLLVRPRSLAAEDPIAEQVQLLKRIAAAVRKEGGTLKAPRPFTDPETLAWVPLPFVGWALGTLGVGLGVACLVALFPLPRPALWFAAAPLVGALGVTGGGRELLALGCALVFPVAAYLFVRPLKLPWLVRGLAMVALSAVGGLCVAALLSSFGYLLRVDQFTGVKLGHFLPIALIGLLLLHEQTDLRKALGTPILWGTAAAGLAGLAVLAVMLGRTGNDSPTGVSGLELQLRSALEALFAARPRTKEFLLGYPALFFGLALADRARQTGVAWHQGLAAVLLTVGSIATTSLINTLCHLHTPLEVSGLRIITGLILGGMIGALGWGGLQRWFRPTDQP